MPERDGGGRVGHDNAGIAKADKRDEESHSGRDGGVEFRRDGVDDQLPYAQHGKQQERKSRQEYRAECSLPRNAHALHYRISEVGVQSHTRCERDGIPGEAAHQKAADGRGETGRGRDGG